MGRGRRRRSRGGLSRRRFLAGGLLSLGGASILGGTQAFSQVDATRDASIQTADDTNGLLGLTIPSVAPVGIENTELISVTNNTEDQLSSSVEILDIRSSEFSDPDAVNLNSGTSQQFTAYLDADRAVEDDPVDVEITGSNQDIGIELTRSVPVPSFSWQVFDNTEYNDVQFDVQYSVDNVPDFNRIEINVTNTVTGMSDSYTIYDSHEAVTYPRDQEREWDAEEGDEYNIVFDVYDANGPVLQKQVTTIGGENDGEGDTGSENDPEFDWVFLDDRSSESDGDSDYGADFAVYYQVSNLDNFGSVEVKFNHADDWATSTTSTEQTPVGLVEYRSSALNDNFDIVVKLENESGMTVDMKSYSDETADGNNPESLENLDISESDSPSFESLNVSDQSQNGGAEYQVDYTIDNEARFGEVRASFDNQSGNDHADETIINSSGAFSHSAIEGDEYHITVRLFENREGVLIPVESPYFEDVAGDGDP